MQLIRTAESGHEEWACPTCGRRILLHWPPDYTKQVLTPGDETACHLARSPDGPPPGPSSAVTDTATAALAVGRRLRETGIDTLRSPARPRLNPSEPV
ncbi:hypothetical protein [Actinomadura formosensis]|uniref:hypothetical protein n=1 Tax=Actinomadura formosensis TaxID=60706 RepID=UPI00082A7D11|nr:hypothetical protein [Actinomadura formosensis]